MEDTDHISPLKAIRDTIVQKRREASTTYAARDVHEPMVVFYQRQIDAIDRAIADEQEMMVDRSFKLDFL